MQRTFPYSLSHVPDYKLTPPAIDPSKTVQRIDLLDQLNYLQVHKKRLLTFEAQAGSGKSIFAQQYILRADCLSGWYQIGPEDQDPITLLTGLVTLFLKSLPGFKSSIVAAALSEGAIHPSEAIRFGEILAQELIKTSGDRFLLILDDLHLLEGCNQSTDLLNTLIQNPPLWMQWVLISRQSIKKTLKVTRFNYPTLRIENHELDFSIEESAELFQSIFSLSIPLGQIQKIQKETEGWITGLVLAALGKKKPRMTLQEEDSYTSHFNEQSKSHLIDFFLQDVLSWSTPDQLQKILQLVLLEDIPTPLLNKLFGYDDSALLIKTMKGNNCFFRSIDDIRGIYSFHHLFRECLLPFAQEQLPEKLQNVTFRLAVDYHLSCTEPLRALHYATCNGDIALCEEILSQYGFDFLHHNQTSTLQHFLNTFRSDTILTFPWLSYYYSTCLQDTVPSEALPYLLKAKELFSEQKNQIGLLLTNTQLVQFHVMIDGQFNLMKDYLVDLEHIFSEKINTLSNHMTLRVAYALALGNCFLQLDMNKVAYYDTMVLNLSDKEGLDNMVASIRLIRAYRCCFVGDIEGTRQEVEASLPLTRNPRVSQLSGLFLRLLQINILEMTGDFLNYQDQKLALEHDSAQQIIIQSIIGPFISIWDIDLALAENDIDTAERLITSALEKCFAASNGHLRSQFLHYYALVLAIRKKKQEALKAIQESLDLRQLVGGNAFYILNHQMIGAAFAQLGMINEAHKHFTCALKLSSAIKDKFQKTSVFAHRAWMLLQIKDQNGALEDIRQCLKGMRVYSQSHFFSFMPHVMEPLLKLALQKNIESGTAREILKDKFHKVETNRGVLIPILDIKLLSDMSMGFLNTQRLSIPDLTKNERQLLLTLVVSPGNQIEQSIISLQFWPDKPTSKQRTSLDVLVSRLRKKISVYTAPVSPVEYIAVEQSIVKLKNCRVDVLQFLTYAKQGRNYVKTGKLWQAGNSFNRAFNHWGESGFNGLNLDETDILKEITEQEFLRSSKIWAHLLSSHGKVDKARQVLENAFHYFPLDVELARQKYDLHALQGNLERAKNIMQRYKSAHHQLSADLNETEEAMIAFWEQPSFSPLS